MSGKFKKGQHLFFLMSGDETQQDSQQKPRYYLNRDRAWQYAKGASEIVEYAPVQYGLWFLIANENGHSTLYECSECGHRRYFADDRFNRDANYCEKCGAKMRRGECDE